MTLFAGQQYNMRSFGVLPFCLCIMVRDCYKKVGMEIINLYTEL
jgi:hypothetical protein